MKMVRQIVVTAAIALGAAMCTAPGVQAAEAVHTDEVCFSVHNTGDSEASAVYGKRYWTKKPTAKTPVIVLVHGVSPDHRYWDLRPDFSVARNLARAGYLVISYDRLGWGRSPYHRAGGGRLLTLSGARDMLHEVVTHVHEGSYAAAGRGGCAAPGRPVGLASDKVVIIGNSAGGGIVNGYAGTYRDVAAVIPIGWSNHGFSADLTAYFATWMPGATLSEYATFLPDEASCTRFVLYVPGMAPGFERFCANGYGDAAPIGETTFLPNLIAENLLSISSVPDGLPILNVWADHDAAFDSTNQTLEDTALRDLTHADFESWTQTDAGHAPAVHRTMPTFTAKVINWLTSKGLGPV